MTFDIEEFRKDLLTQRIIRNKLTLRQAAIEIGVSAATISRVERSHMPDIETFCKICLWLDTDPRMYFFLPKKSKL